MALVSSVFVLYMFDVGIFVADVVFVFVFVVGAYNGVVLKFYMERVEGFYLIKVLSVIIMLTSLSFTTMMIYEEVENNNHNNNNNNNNNNNSTTTAMHTVLVRTVSVASFAERINLSVAVLLACVAFQYLISENLPKTGYMTTMDNLLMTSFITIFAGALETVLCRLLSKHNMDEASEMLDDVCLIAFPVLFFIVQGTYSLHAVLHRYRERMKAETCEDRGVAKSLLISHVDSVEEVNTHRGFVKSHNAQTIDLMEDAIDDVNVVDQFLKETEEMAPMELLRSAHHAHDHDHDGHRTLQGSHHTGSHSSSSRSLFGPGVKPPGIVNTGIMNTGL